jgi:hypothetical protein
VSPPGGAPNGSTPETGPAGDIRIGRLALRVAGLDEDAARELARLVAERLTPGLLRVPGLAGPDSLHVQVQAGAAEQGETDLLARRIVDQIGRVLARDRVSDGPDGEVAG